MRIANSNGRAVIVLGNQIADVAQASAGEFGPDPMDAYRKWTAFTEFAASVSRGTGPLVEASLRNPVPSPAQVFAIGLNYRAHAAESGMSVPAVPATFTKFPASLTGPYDDIEIGSDSTDWEVELVAVIGRLADRVNEADAWTHVAGLTVGQDISDRHLQFAAAAQFSLGKSAEATARSVPGSSPRTSLPTPAISRSAAPLTARSCRRAEPVTSSSPFRGSLPSFPRSCRCCRAT